MKPIFCTDITVDKHNTVINGSEFITNSISEEKRAEMDARADELQNLINQAKTPGWMVTLRSIAGFGSLIMAMNLFQVVMEKGFSALFAADQIMGTSICLGAVALWFYLDRQGKMKVKRMENNPELKAKNNALEVEIALMMHEMGVPASAKPMDVLVFNYKTKDGKVEPVSPAMLPQIYMNFECKAFDGGDSVSIADSENVYTFKKSDIKMLRVVDAKSTVYSWNKQDEPTSSKYAAYGLSLNKMGMATTSSYYIVEIEKDGETFGLYVPSYEAEILREVFGFDSALDIDGDMVELPKYVEADDYDDEENALPEADEIEETEEAEEATEALESDTTEGEEDEATDETDAEEAIESDESDDEVDTDEDEATEVEESEGDETLEDEESEDENDTNDGDSDEEPKEEIQE